MFTKVEVIKKTAQSQHEIGDVCYIDNWVTAARSARPYAMIVRLSDGAIDFADFHSIKAIGFIEPTAEED